jgi:ethanolamine utilization protein EutN
MLVGTVYGPITATKRLWDDPKGALLKVDLDPPYVAMRRKRSIIAFDVLGCGSGERVLVAQGTLAASWFSGKSPPVDAVIIGSVD